MRAVILISLFLATFANASTFVGNGGDGIIEGNKVFLRDLYAFGLKENVDIGHARNRALQIPASFFQFPVPSKLLERKLTEINEEYPPIGDFLKLAILNFEWKLTNEVLIPTNDDQVDPADWERPPNFIQIANRLAFDVRIWRPAWVMMDNNHKVALLIHEAVFGLVKTSCLEGKIECFQSCFKARELTAELFLKRLNRRDLYQLAYDLLDIPKDELSLPASRLLPFWKIESRAKTFQMDISPKSLVSIHAQVERICEIISKPGASKDRFVSTVRLPAYRLINNAYIVSSEKEIMSQSRMRIDGYEKYLLENINIGSVNLCAYSLRRHEDLLIEKVGLRY